MVFTIKRFTELSLRVRGILDRLGLTSIHYRIGDGSLGWPDEAPFDRVLVTAAAPSFPMTLFGQPKEGGLLVATIVHDELLQLTVVRKRKGKLMRREVMSCRSVKLVGKERWSDLK